MVANGEISQQQPQQPPGEYRWQCQKCGDTIEGTPTRYLNFCSHHPKKSGCTVSLIDETGQVVADSEKDAKRKGLFDRKTQPQEETGVVKPPKPGQPLLQGFFKTQLVELDPKVQLYHQVFMDEGLIPNNTTLGQFIFSAIETLLEVTGRKLAIVQRKKGD